MRVERAGAESTAARIAGILERAQLDRPPAERLADRIAARFVTAVVLVAIGVFGAWRAISPDDALWVTLSVLVATCPCALSLATPAALASASAGLAERGFLIARGHVLETLGRVTHVVFDKTGTLTVPDTAAGTRDRAGAWTATDCLGLARALERHAGHPIARAITERPVGPDVARAESRFATRLRAVEVCPGRGVEAVLDGRHRVRLGRPDWVVPAGSAGASPDVDAEDGGRVALAVGEVLAGWLDVGADVRPGATDLVAGLRARGIAVSLSSGDPSEEAVRRLAERVGITTWEARQMPEDKLARLAALQQAGDTVAVLGDGINDAPMLGRADVGIALGSGADLARVTADAVVLGESLAVVEDAWRQAARTRRVVRQNFTWAVVYNVAVLPAAAAGLVVPWMAAVGMSASSLLVVANSLRLRRPGRRAPTGSGAGGRVPAPAGRPAWVES
jgi:Cu2+-exporting ATPase